VVFVVTVSRAVIFANGRIRDGEAIRRELLPEDSLIAADGGLRHLRRLRLLPHVLIGDLDSLSNGEKRRLKAAGVRILIYPRDKDQTDLELALDLAVREGHKTILVVAPFGGRVDQTAANLLLLGREDLRGRNLRLFDGQTEAFLITRQASLQGRKGEVVSLLPLGGEVQGIATRGLRYPLQEEALQPSRTRGLSNRLSGPEASISVRRGMLLCIHVLRRRRSAIRRPAAEGGRSK
jgi:thiamine pyrophosphokinase